MDAMRQARLLNDFQRAFPLVREPFAELAERVDADECDVRATLAARIGDGTISRIGAVFAPGAVGCSTLAAMSVPERELERVAAIVSARPEVNHNYEREHALNLWFVAAAVDRARLDATLSAIERDTGCGIVALPMIRGYALDLGFGLDGDLARHNAAARRHRVVEPRPLSPSEMQLVRALEGGLPIVQRPYRALGAPAGLDENDVLASLAAWIDEGIVSRFGIVVRHRALGYTANAMCVWDVPDAEVDAVGERLAAEGGVTLCYRRARSASWRYNLFCMIHGRARGVVEQRIAELDDALQLSRYPSAVLFSRRAFKQCGARYAAPPAGEPAAA
jgi:DNA-binding Lrp family transcriptional regulator